MTVTLELYERAEREVAIREGRIALVVHAVVTAIVWAVLIPVNVFAASAFPWSAFVVGGMALGLFFHWFGYRRSERDLRNRQARIESRAHELLQV